MKQKHAVLALVLGGVAMVVNHASGQLWTLTIAPQATGESSWNWRSAACSADGTKLVAAGWKGRNCSIGWCDYFDIASSIYTSTDAGLTWNQTSSPTNVWSAVASSADGAKLVAVSPAGIYTSTNSGVTWTQSSAPPNGWSSIASSVDGTKLAAAALGSSLGDGLIYTSADSGVSWTPSGAPSNSWTSIASSADGNRLLAAGGGNDTNGLAIMSFIYTSMDSGATWTQSSAPNTSWTSVASSADGTILAAAATGYRERIYTSTDSGATWTRNDTLPTAPPFAAVAASADGTTLVAAVTSGIYRSTDSGSTWTPTFSLFPGGLAGAPFSLVSSLACSADGGFVLAAGNGIYTWPYSGPWEVTIGIGAPSNGFAAVASSADGTKLVAAEDSGEFYGAYSSMPCLIFTSTNSGVTWTESTAPSNYWSAVASSADGVRLAATTASDLSGFQGTGSIYTSLDSGTTWTRASLPSNSWYSIASSADGNTLAVLSWTNIYISKNGGTTWNQTEPAEVYYWSSICISEDGAKLAAASHYSGPPAYNGRIITSTNYGATWALTSAPENYWTSVASSADGTKLVAAADGYFGDGFIYTSTDAGVTWTKASAPTRNWKSLASSSDGARLIAIGSVGEFNNLGDSCISTDSGATWTLLRTPADLNFYGPVASSTDGSNIVAVSANHLYTMRFPTPPSPPPPSPKLNIGLSVGSFDVSWIVPSTSFALQQNSDLSGTNWTDVPTAPSLNFTNLHYEVTVWQTNGQGFYRLRQQ